MTLRIAWLTAAMLPCAALAAELPKQAPPPPGTQGVASLDGVIHAFTLSADGTVNGLLLDDGAEVHVARPLAQDLARAVKPGDAVHVQGWRTSTPGVVDATSVNDARTGRAVVERGAPPPPALGHAAEETPSRVGLPRPGAREATVQGRILRPLHGPTGALDGAILGDGTELRLPPDRAPEVAKLLEPGTRVAAQGYAFRRPEGQVMAVQAIGTSPDELVPIAPAPAPAPAPVGALTPSRPPAP